MSGIPAPPTLPSVFVEDNFLMTSWDYRIIPTVPVNFTITLTVSCTDSLYQSLIECRGSRLVKGLALPSLYYLAFLRPRGGYGATS